jgi:hypothetical protein
MTTPSFANPPRVRTEPGEDLTAVPIGSYSAFGRGVLDEHPVPEPAVGALSERHGKGIAALGTFWR